MKQAPVKDLRCTVSAAVGADRFLRQHRQRGVEIHPAPIGHLEALVQLALLQRLFRVLVAAVAYEQGCDVGVHVVGAGLDAGHALVIGQLFALVIDLFRQVGHIETVCLLSKLQSKEHIEIEVKMDELDLTSAESKATYDEIKAYVLEKHGLKVSSLYISQVKRKCGLDVGQNYNLSKKEDAKVPQCPPEKEAAIMDALKHFQMI